MEKPIQTGAIGATLGQLAAQLGGELLGPAEFQVERLTSADTADPGGIAFAEKQSYVVQAKAAGVGSLLIGPDMDPDGIPAIRVANPRIAFFMLLTRSDHPYPLASGVHRTAVIMEGAEIEEGVSVGPYAVVEATATLRQGAQVFAHAYIGEFCELKASSMVLPHAVLLRNVELGARSVIFPGSVLGADGFGFVWDGQRRVKVPQVGRVVIADDCEIGALTAIDRATAGSTSLGVGTKIDNLVQIGHNCKIGEHVVIAAVSGIGGTTTIGDRAMLGGMSGAADHAHIGADVILGGRAGVIGRIDEPGVYLDFPTQPAKLARRNMVLRTKLDEMHGRIRDLEARLAKLEGGPA
ncbi:MAG TPA: UDP-3-O-(3-hydroxymyristoyl)glucosamine N-acyltransferase [Fimbriimonadaceae bacterium]|nr:UDP-3-O-(3-hydroxymyristoyl)glucosamine N-acyltransferase [Fimbriimonadaceae bacterium]